MNVVKSALIERNRQTGIQHSARIAKLLAASAAIVLLLIWFVTAFEIVTFAHRTPTLGDLGRATRGALVNPGFQKMLFGLFVLPMLFSVLLATVAVRLHWNQSRPRISRGLVRFGSAFVYVSVAFGRIPSRALLPALAVGLLFALIGLVAEWAFLRGRDEPAASSSAPV